MPVSFERRTNSRFTPFAIFGEQVVVNAWLVVKTFEKSRGHQLDQVVVTLQRFAEQHQVVAAARARLALGALSAVASIRLFAALMTAAARDVHFAADDRLDVALARFIEKISRGEQVAVVGN